MPIDLENADLLLTTTRGVRRRLDFDRAVDPQVIEKCVEVAMQAPVGSSWNTHFVAVTDETKRKQIAQLYAQVSHPYLDQLATSLQENSIDASDTQKAEKEMRMHRWYTDNLHRAPVLMIVAMDGRFETVEPARRSGAYGSNLPVAWSFMLALRARGLGTCWTTLHIYKEPEVAAILGMPDNLTHTVLFPIAYYKGSDFRPANRPNHKSYLHWNQW